MAQTYTPTVQRTLDVAEDITVGEINIVRAASGFLDSSIGIVQRFGKFKTQINPETQLEEQVLDPDIGTPVLDEYKQVNIFNKTFSQLKDLLINAVNNQQITMQQLQDHIADLAATDAFITGKAEEYLTFYKSLGFYTDPAFVTRERDQE